MRRGFHGRILRVDLSSSTLAVEELSEDLYRKYMGGSALNLHYILKETPPRADPLGPENVLALGVGVTTGLAISGQSRLTISAKSPLTGAIGDSQSGGMLPARLKMAGFDTIIVKGRSERPAYLWIDDGQAEIRSASALWGKTTGEVQASIRNELGDEKIEVLQIGPAGEKLVRFASVINMCNRANGRTGMGAVMGSKNLKAIAVRGKMTPAIADKEAFGKLARWGVEAFPNSSVAPVGKYGTAVVVSGQNAAGGLPSFNFNRGVFDGWEAIDGVTLYDNYLAGCGDSKQDKEGRETCFGCVIRCKRVVEINEGPYKVDPLYGGPEYETIATFGSYCGVDDLPAICKANEICNRYGLDTISCGATIAWAMEAFEAGVLTTEHTGGLEIKFGDAKTLVKLTKMIGERKGFGDILAEGSAHAAKTLSHGAEFLITCKDQEAPAHMPQVKRSLALIYASNPFGADHMSSDHDPFYEKGTYEDFADQYEAIGLNQPVSAQSLAPAKVEFARKTQYLYSLMDSLNLCHFAWGPSWQLYGPDHMIELVKAVTGWDVTMAELLEVGERRLNMMRAFNAREGFSRRQDKLPDKFFNVALKGGPSDGLHIDRVEFEAALDEYYRQSGWDLATGNPSTQTLRRLDLEWVSEMLTA